MKQLIEGIAAGKWKIPHIHYPDGTAMPINTDINSNRLLDGNLADRLNEWVERYYQARRRKSAA